MSEFLGARISLISKSDIRYVGVLHEINSAESTVSLENVRSFGSEGRKGNPEEEIAPSDQVYEYIVFRGSDVKDLRIEQTPTAVKENKPPAVPDDPAIVGARARPVNNAPGPANPQGPPGAPGFGGPNSYYMNNAPPPPPGHWGRGGPGPGAFGPAGMPYPPWMGPGQGFPPNAPGPWGTYPYPPGPPPPGAPGQRPRGQSQDQKPMPIGAGTGQDKPSTPAGQGERSGEPRPIGQQLPTRGSPGIPTPPVDSKPSVEEVKATAESLRSTGQMGAAADAAKTIPTGPKHGRVMPAVPLPTTILSRSTQATVSSSHNLGPDTIPAAIQDDATQAAKAAVAVAMAKLDPSGLGQGQNGTAIDNLTNKVNEMRVGAGRGGQGRGRGRGGRPGAVKVEVPDADFDFASSNAKFNKQDVVKEAIAGSPLAEAPNGSVSDAPDAMATGANPAQAYNKTKSFFDNISSEAKDRADSGGQKPGGREWRGEEQRKNMETFGQGSVDGGSRPTYRGRGRGRGGMRGRGFGGGRGRGSGYRGGRDAQISTQ